MPKASEMTDAQKEHLELSIQCIHLLEKGIPREFPHGKSVVRIFGKWTHIITYESISLEARYLKGDFVEVDWLAWRPRVFLRDLAREGPGSGVWEGIEFALVRVGNLPLAQEDIKST